MLTLQNVYYLSEEGTLDPRLSRAMTRTAILGVKDQPGFQYYWGIRRETFMADFADYVEELIATDAGSLGRVYGRAEADSVDH